ncbi:MAG: GntR family transcriptional regulator [Burkholderiales bacterium]|nr:GntR family transcriptional regulator [Burkholderiales bacterium]MDE2159943.1 GntR family transcriptional regulator [Burkholderiales bacterium]
MRFSILPSATEPIYRQIIEQVRRQVASGQWPAGTELPSIRNVAQEHAINPMTVSKAYSLLEAEGLLERRRGMGMVIAAIRPAGDPDQRLALLEPTLRDAARQAAQLGLGRAEVIALLRRCLDEATED